MAEEKDRQKEAGFQVEQPGTLVNLTEARERSESITSNELARVRAQIEAVESGHQEPSQFEEKSPHLNTPIRAKENNGETKNKPVKKPIKPSGDSRYFMQVEERRLRKAA